MEKGNSDDDFIVVSWDSANSDKYVLLTPPNLRIGERIFLTKNKIESIFAKNINNCEIPETIEHLTLVVLNKYVFVAVGLKDDTVEFEVFNVPLVNNHPTVKFDYNYVRGYYSAMSKSSQQSNRWKTITWSAMDTIIT